MDECSEINDLRCHFKGIAFSNFKLTDVRKELLSNLILGKIEPACYWSAELICSSHINELWEILFFFYCKYIHLGNPKIAIYLENRMRLFKLIVNNGYIDDEIRLRNNPRIRNLFAEIICILCKAKRKHCLESVSISREDFDMTRIGDILKAPHANFADTVFLSNDPKELFVGINEFCFHISEENKNVIQACFWVEWILEFEMLCKRNVSSKIKCERRANMPVDAKYQMDIIWILWDALISLSARSTEFLQRAVQSLLHIFCLRYSPGCARRRKFVLYFAISLLCESPAVVIEAAKEEIIREEEKGNMAILIKNINLIYKQVKKNEVAPNTGYLFANIKNNNLEKTIQKLDAIVSFDESFIPRISEEK